MLERSFKMPLDEDRLLGALKDAARSDDVLLALGGIIPAAVARAETAIAIHNAFHAMGAERAGAAEAWLDRAMALAPGDPSLVRKKGDCHRGRGEWRAAMKRYRQAVKARPGNLRFRALLATAYRHLGNDTAAVRELRAAAARDEANSATWLRLGHALIGTGDFQGAMECFERAAALQAKKAPEGEGEAHAPLAATMVDGLRRALAMPGVPLPAKMFDAYYQTMDVNDQDARGAALKTLWTALVDDLRGLKALSVLEFGCGDGWFAERLHAASPEVDYVGLDFSVPALARARRRCPNFRFDRRDLVQADLSRLPAFDSVIAIGTLDCLERDRELISVIPEGTRLLLVLGVGPALGRLREFPDADAVRARYGGLIQDLEVTAIELGGERRAWKLLGQRAPLALAIEVADPLAVVAMATSAIDLSLWTDGTRYVEDVLSAFGLPFVPLFESLGLAEPHVALRHDVDRSIENALVGATIEKRLGARSTFFLLHPDGIETPANYFGAVENDRLSIHDSLFDWAQRLLDLGHEVALHNDLISLAIATRRQPREFLEQIVEAFAKRNMPLRGNVAHGTGVGLKYGFINYQIFEETRDRDVFVDYRMQEHLFEQYAKPTVETDGHVIEKFNLRMADYGLAYEANFVPWEVYMRDNGAAWSICLGQDDASFARFTPAHEPQTALANAMRRKQPRTAVQCLVHFCHWTTMAHLPKHVFRQVVNRSTSIFEERRREATAERLKAFENIILASKGDDRFAGYDKDYGNALQFYALAPTVSSFVDKVAEDFGRSARSIFEVGCGQGDLLAAVRDRCARVTDGSAPQGLGVDGSVSAILTSASRYPDLRWAADSLEHFLEVHDATVHTDDGQPLRHDLILDKNGTLFIESYDGALSYLERVSAVMSPGAHYVYIIARFFHDKMLFKKVYSHWPTDWFGLLDKTFDLVLNDDDELAGLRGFYKRVYRKRG